MYYQFTSVQPSRKTFPFQVAEENADLKTKVAVASAIRELSNKLILTGGEPLSDPTILPFLLKVHDKFKSIIVETYGVGQAHSVGFALEQIHSTGVEVAVNIYLASPDPRLDEKVMGPGHYESALSTYAFLVHHFSYPVYITTFLHEKFPYDKAISLANYLGTTVNVMRYPKTPIQEVAKLFEVIKTEPLSIMDHLVLYMQGAVKHSSTSHMFVSPKGDLYLYRYRMEGPFGNVVQDMTQAVLRAEQAFQEELTKPLNEACGSCPLRDKCNGGNPEFWTSGTNRGDILCPMKALISTPTTFLP